MTQRKWYYSNYLVTVPANTAIAAPVTIGLPTGDIWLESVRYYIPAGSGGCMGWYLAQSGVPIFPWTGNLAWIVENNVNDEIDVGDELQGNLAVVGYNLGQFQHQIRLRLKYYPAVLIGENADNPVIIPTSQLSSSVSVNSSNAPADGVTPAADGSCPIGYVIDPNGSGLCIPASDLPAPSTPTDGGTGTDGSINPILTAPGVVVGAAGADLGVLPLLADGSCPIGYVLASDGSGLCIPIGDLEMSVSS